jgi:ABC-type antimicrobial peptide transport system ATPase subunit
MDAVDARWDDALKRLQAYLGELEVGGAEHRTRVALRLLDQARQTVEGRDPVEHTLTLAQGELMGWFGQALEGSSLPANRKIAWGLMAWRMVGGAARWPNVMLDGAPPEEVKRVLVEVSLQAAPDLAVSRMISRDMDYGAMETLAQETWHQFAWAPLLRAAALWTAIFFASLYIYDRFFS